MGPTVSKDRSPRAALPDWGNSKVTYFIDRENLKDYEEDSHLVKLLLLGAGESGKTTLLKQMKLLYGQDHSDFVKKQKESNVRAIRTNVLGNLQSLFKACEGFHQIASDDFDHKLFNKFLEKRLIHSVELTADEVDMIESLWEDEGVRKTWEENRNLIQVQDALPYFMSKFRHIFSNEFVPNSDDWLRVRVRTTGVTEAVFSLDGVNFKIVDVGGQRSERKKWLNCFAGVSAVIYVSALNEYDQVLFEDHNRNRMVESLDLFEETACSETLEGIHWILFLNKSDLYEEKLTTTPISVKEGSGQQPRFEDFDDENWKPGMSINSPEFKISFDAGTKYFEEKFKARILDPTKIVTVHITCAMDQHNVDIVFNAVRTIVITKILGASGFISEV